MDLDAITALLIHVSIVIQISIATKISAIKTATLSDYNTMVLFHKAKKCVLCALTAVTSVQE